MHTISFIEGGEKKKVHRRGATTAKVPITGIRKRFIAEIKKEKRTVSNIKISPGKF